MSAGLAERVLPLLREAAAMVRQFDLADRGGWTTQKGPHDYQTNVDVVVEDFVCSRLRQLYPLDAIISEEKVNQPGSTGRVWVVDPLDGTRNFLNGRPEIAVSIGLAVEATPVFGAIALPMRDALLCHALEQAAPIVEGVSRRRPLYEGALDHGLVAVPADFRTKADEDDYVRLAESLVGHVDGLRTSGAMAYDLATLCLGEISARVSLGTKDVDCVGGVAVVEAMGGVVTGLDGQPWRIGEPTIVAAMDRGIHSDLLSLVKRARPD